MITKKAEDSPLLFCYIQLGGRGHAKRQSDSYTGRNAHLQEEQSEAQPFMASGVYAWLTGTVLPTLPTKVRNVIKAKRLYMPTRYNASQKLTDDNSWADKSFPSLWLPFEGEIFDHISWSTKGYGTACCVQYGIFKNSWKARMKRYGNGGSFGNWWTASASSGGATGCVYVNASGMSNNNNTSNTNGVPV